MNKKNGLTGIPESARVIRGVAHVPLTDEFHQDTPMAYLVKRHDENLREYDLFQNHGAAARFSELQSQLYEDDTGEPTDWDVYPLYASHPLNRWCD